MSTAGLLHDRPVGEAEESIWKRTQPPWKGSELYSRLDQIAATFVAPLSSDEPRSSLTIAVNGAWGAGKSSALRVIEDLARDRARQAAEARLGAAASEGDVKAFTARLKFCKYAAPVWQASPMEARTTLVARMLASLAGSVDKAVEQLFVPARAVAADLGATAQPGDAEGRALWTAEVWKQISTVFSRLQDLDELLRGWLTSDGPTGEHVTKAVLVVLVDDLDRCDPGFVYTVLSELHQLGAVKNLFFVIAADEGTLCRAVQHGVSGPARSELDAAHELGKLIQHAVTVPLLDERATLRLLQSLLPAAEGDLLAGRLRSEEGAGSFWRGLPERTPRAVKRCINAIGDSLRRDLSGQELSPMDADKRIKEAMLSYTWGGFYRRHFEPMTDGGGRRDHEALYRLQQLVSRFGDDGDTRLAREVAYLCEEYPLLGWKDVPLDLVKFLGSQPYLLEPSMERPAMPASAAAGLAPPVKRPLAGRAFGFPVFTAKDPSERGPGPTAITTRDLAESGPLMRGGNALSLMDELPDEVEGEPEPSADGVLSDALSRARSAAATEAVHRIAAQAVLDLARFEPSSDAAARSVARALLPRLEKSPGDGALLAAVLDRYVMLLRRAGLQDTAGRALHDAYVAARQVPYVRDAYAMFLKGAGAMEAARKVGMGEEVQYRQLVTDAPQGADPFAASAVVKALLAELAARSRASV